MGEAESIREWFWYYRQWNEQKLVERLQQAGKQPLEEKLAEFFDLCEAMRIIAPQKSPALYEAQLRHHIRERNHITRFEELRKYGKSTASPCRDTRSGS